MQPIRAALEDGRVGWSVIFVDTNVFVYAVGREAEDVKLARSLAGGHTGLKARDLLHIACCKRREVSRIKTFDRGLASSF